jgi:protein-tyrosine phosphatase
MSFLTRMIVGSCSKPADPMLFTSATGAVFSISPTRCRHLDQMIGSTDRLPRPTPSRLMTPRPLPPDRTGHPRRVLFLCTGNYYRSRYADILFNHHAVLRGIAWRAFSRGLAVERGVNNVGPMSRTARERLEARGVQTDEFERFPAPVTPTDLEEAARIVALKEIEHRPLMIERFPGWVGRTEFWNVDDVDVGPADEALSLIDRTMETLLTQLSWPQPADELTRIQE